MTLVPIPTDAIHLGETAATLLSEAEAEEQATVKVLRTQQKMTVGAFETYRDALQNLETDTRVTQESVSKLNTEADDNRELIKTASEITASGVDIARQEAKAAVDEGMDEFLAVLSFTLQALGIDEKQLALQVNIDRIDPNRGIYLPCDFVSKLAEIHARMGVAREASTDGPVLRSV